MSEYTSVASKVFKDRYANASYWSTKPQNTMPANRPIEMRIMTILHPGSVYARDGGFFGVKGDVGLSYQGMGFRLPTLGWEERAIAYGTYDDAGVWFKRDWSLYDLQQAGLSAAYVQYLETARKVFTKAMQIITWVPTATALRWDRAMAAGGMPWMSTTSEMRSMGTLPPWLANNPGRQAAWDALAGQFRQIMGKIIAGNIAQQQADMERLMADVRFWDTVAQYSGVDKIEQLWNDFKAKIRQFNTQGEIIHDNLRQMKALIATDPDAFTPEQKDKVNQIEAKDQAIVAQAKQTMQGPVMKALTDEGMNIQGLGLGPLVLIGMGVGIAAIVGATTAFVVYVNNRSALTSESNAALKDFITSREQVDNREYQLEMQAIRTRETQLQDLRDQGKLDPAEFNRQMADLQRRKQVASQTLLQSRELTIEASAELNENLKKAQEDIAGGFLGPMKWIAMAGAVGLVSVFVVPRLFSKK